MIVCVCPRCAVTAYRANHPAANIWCRRCGYGAMEVIGAAEVPPAGEEPSMKTAPVVQSRHVHVPMEFARLVLAGCALIGVWAVVAIVGLMLARLVF